ncbi:BCCT family transporter [Haloplanus litoreus]|uniref:BCCT family transporter n=1 Tax=Haloplanus litoreus TaxID=767515 RepID=UPI00361696D3
MLSRAHRRLHRHLRRHVDAGGVDSGDSPGDAPTTGSIVFWGVLQGLVAVAVLLVGGGESLQTVAVSTGGPFAVLSLVSLVGLTRTFRRHERGHSTLLNRAVVVLADTPLGRAVDGDHED